jgi:hypothetical protein
LKRLKTFFRCVQFSVNSMLTRQFSIKYIRCLNKIQLASRIITYSLTFLLDIEIIKKSSCTQPQQLNTGFISSHAYQARNVLCTISTLPAYAIIRVTSFTSSFPF